MLHYIIQTVAFQLFFLVIYDVFLKKETFFNWNRAYLLATSLLSLVLPFIKVDRFSKVIPEEYVVNLPQVVIGKLSNQKVNSVDLGAIAVDNTSIWTWQLLLYSGMLIASVILLYKIGKLALIIHKNPKRWKDNLLIVNLLNSTNAFSFFHYIFLGERIPSQERMPILKHEQVHVEQKHTIDLLYFEILRILFWFNPLVYMYQNRTAELHEFIADAKAIKLQDKKDYYENLLSQVFETQNLSFINPFFKKSLIKKRILMLSKHPSKQKKLLKYALLIPVLLTMLVYTSASAQEKETQESSENRVDSELLEVLQKQFDQDVLIMENNGASSMAVFWNHFSLPFDNDGNYYKYIISEEDFSKIKAECKDGYNRLKNKGSNKSNREKKQIKILKEISKSSYQEYLEYRRSDEGIENWEVSVQVGELRLVVDNIDNYTIGELIKFGLNKKVYEDQEFDFLTISDEKSTKVIKKDVILEYLNIREVIETQELENQEVPFGIIEQVPVYPGCEGLSPEEQKGCMSKKISEYVSSNFNVKLGDSLGLVGRVKINTIFKINKEGVVVGIRARAPHPDLEKEAIRIISELPQMKPGMQKGKPVIVPYSLPIIFEVKGKQVAESSPAKIPPVYQSVDESAEVPFAIIEQPPVYPGCENLSPEEQKNCMATKLSKHVAKNFNVKLANDLGLVGRQKINVMFKVNKDGNIEGIKARAPHPELEKEAIRVISGIPKVKPGLQKGKVVTVPYSLPIVFQVHSNDENESQEPSDDELLQKGYDEILRMEEDGVNFLDFNKIIQTDNYISTKEEYYRSTAYIKHLHERAIKRKIEKGRKNPKGLTKVLKNRKTYKEYLEFKKTQKGRDLWENSSREGVIKLMVGDLDNMTTEEKRRYDDKKMYLDDDKYPFYKFLISDGKETRVLINSNKKKSD